jgi:DNA-binding transcriptional LysR family regulator
LRAFEAAARHASMRRGAEEIGLSHTVVSRQVRDLEHWFGRKLVRTSPRGVTLTAEGEALLATVSRAFEAIAAVAQDLRRERQHGRLSIWCYSGLATRWLTPRLSELEAALGSVEIELRATEDVPDFAAKQADAFIGYGAPPLPYGALTLAAPRMFPVASPSWLARHGRPADLDALIRLPLIHERSRQQWTSWFERAGHTPAVLSGPRLSDAGLSFDAALAGQGVALVNGLMAADELANGTLLELFDSDIVLGSYYLLVAPARANDATMLAFRDWLVASIARAGHP